VTTAGLCGPESALPRVAEIYRQVRDLQIIESSNEAYDRLDLTDPRGFDNLTMRERQLIAATHALRMAVQALTPKASQSDKLQRMATRIHRIERKRVAALQRGDATSIGIGLRLGRWGRVWVSASIKAQGVR
jgi:hypothetical protein